MAKKTVCVAVAALIIVTVSGTGRAEDRDTLKGLQSLDVLIEDLAPEAESDGLTTSALRSDIETELRQGGITVTEDATETLYVNVNAHRTSPGDGRYMYNIEMRISQPVVVLRTNGVTMAATWSRAIIGSTALALFPSSVRGDLHALLKTLLGDYSAVNPKSSADDLKQQPPDDSPRRNP